MAQKQLYWQKIRGITILAVIFIHCQSGSNCSSDSFNGISYFIMRNIVNFAVNMFFFVSGYFMKPVNDIIGFYKKRLPRLMIPYLFFSCAYLAIKLLFGNSLDLMTIISALFLGTASIPLYYIIVLLYFTLLSPFLIKAVRNKLFSMIILASTPMFLCLSYFLLNNNINIWDYLKYTPVWLSFYYLGILLKEHKPILNKTILWLLLPVSFVLELYSTKLLENIDSFNEYTQLRFAGMIYSAVLILLTYEYSKNNSSDNNCNVLVKLGDDSYAIYYMHYACLLLFTSLFEYKENYNLLIYQISELLFSLLICELMIFIIKKMFKNKKIQMIFGV